MRIERELAELVTRCPPIAAEEGTLARRACIRRDAEIETACLAHHRQASRDRARCRGNRRWPQRSWLSRSLSAEAIPGRARRPRSPRGSPSDVGSSASVSPMPLSENFREPARFADRAAAAEQRHRQWLLRRAATARRPNHRRPCVPAKTDHWDRRPADSIKRVGAFAHEASISTVKQDNGRARHPGWPGTCRYLFREAQTT